MQGWESGRPEADIKGVWGAAAPHESGRPEADIKGGVGGGSPPRIREAGRPTYYFYFWFNYRLPALMDRLRALILDRLPAFFGHFSYDFPMIFLSNFDQ